MDRFFIIANKIKDTNLEKTKAVAQFLELRGKKCQYLAIDRVFQSETEPAHIFSTIPSDTDCVISLGGDGTLIQIAGIVAKKNIPILGVNMGNLGYLCEVEKDGLFDALEKLINDECEITGRMMLQGEPTICGTKMSHVNALNDIVLSRHGRLGTASFRVYVNGSELYTCNSDGMIISTPTGSTGYNLSAGGPIVAPYSNAIVLTPIAAHKLNIRPVVLSDRDEVVVELLTETNTNDIFVEAHFDGGKAMPLSKGDFVKVKRSVLDTKIIKINQASFFETLSKKMSE